MTYNQLRTYLKLNVGSRVNCIAAMHKYLNQDKEYPLSESIKIYDESLMITDIILNIKKLKKL